MCSKRVHARTGALAACLQPSDDVIILWAFHALGFVFKAALSFVSAGYPERDRYGLLFCSVQQIRLSPEQRKPRTKGTLCSRTLGMKSFPVILGTLWATMAVSLITETTIVQLDFCRVTEASTSPVQHLKQREWVSQYLKIN